QLKRKGLVEQLRQSDIHGAPLVFQAAASSKIDFLKCVCAKIEHTLGRSELRQQLQASSSTNWAIDLKKRSIIFHAAKGHNAEVFQAVVDGFDGRGELFQAFGDRGNGNPLTARDGEEKAEDNDTHRKSWLLLRDHRSETTDLVLGRVEPIGEGYVVAVDYRGMNVLHIACRWGCHDIVDKVICEARRQGQSFIKDLLNSVDDDGNTPLMHALRRENLGDLLRVLVDQNDNKSLSKSEQLKLFTEPASRGHNSTALMHAAYAGPERLEIVRERIECLYNLHLPSASQPCQDDDGLDLDFALGAANEDGEK
ncbi:unnamed protein product, partial [Hapterophycus canaliculatus]